MNSPNISFNINDFTFEAGDIAAGRSGVIVKTKRGPVGKTDLLITSWPQFKRIFGGLIAGEQGPELCKRALERGSALRVSRAMHYTDPTDATTADGAFAVVGSSRVYTIAAGIAAGQTITFTNGTATAQAFDTDAATTMKKFVAQIALRADVVAVKYLSSTSIYVTLSTALATGTVTTGGAGAPAVTTTTVNGFIDSNSNVLFTLSPKYMGADYNNLLIYTSAATNGNANYFDLTIVFLGEDIEPEVYRNLTIPGRPTVVASKYLNDVVTKSQWVNVTYSDLSGIGGAGTLVPTPIALKYKSGADGSALVATDYIGDSAGKTGVYAFDGVDDVMQIAVLDDISGLTGVEEALASYADTRKDLQTFTHIEAVSENALVTNRRALNINTPYHMFFGGGVEVVDLLNGQQKIISELGDVLGICAYSEEKMGPWYSPAGPRRGRVLNCVGAGNKYGAHGNKPNLDLLAQNQINVVINRNNQTLLWGFFTSQLLNSQMSFGSIVRLNIYIKKSLAPVLERFLEEPNDIETWKAIYTVVKPFLDGLVEKRALFDYRWEGDQFAKEVTDAELKVNNAADVSLGKYKARLYCKDIATLQEFAIDINLTRSDVSFEDAVLISQ